MSAALDIVQVEVGLLENFCEVIGCPHTGEAALVDPAFEVGLASGQAERCGVAPAVAPHGAGGVMVVSGATVFRFP